MLLIAVVARDHIFLGCLFVRARSTILVEVPLVPELATLRGIVIVCLLPLLPLYSRRRGVFFHWNQLFNAIVWMASHGTIARERVQL